jgi:3-oxoacyl-[acyl-carrier-protein] synthase I
MSGMPLCVVSSGMVTPVGLTAPATCAAIRSGLANPTPSLFTAGNEAINAHAVQLQSGWGGRPKLIRMLELAVLECLAAVPRDLWIRIPLLLCVAERERPGRLPGLEDELLVDIQAQLATRFGARSCVIPQGRIGAMIALAHARTFLGEPQTWAVLIAATDTLLNAPTMRHYEKEGRLLTAENSNGFMPGEGAAAILLAASGPADAITVRGLGFAPEESHIDSGRPLRADGLSGAILAATADAGCSMADIDFRIADLSGEQFYFKESALAVARCVRERRENFGIWHPAECLGNSGAALGPAMLAVALASSRKSYALGPNILCHAGNDAGGRAAVVLNSGAQLYE